MIIEKVIIVSRTFDDPIQACSSDDIIWHALKQYEGRCIKSGLILKVLSIINPTPCTINAMDSHGSGTMNFEIKVKMLEYYDGEIITGCKIINKDTTTSTLMCVVDRTNLMVPYQQLMDSLTVGQYISVVVQQAKYTIGGAEICVLGKFYSFNFNPYVFTLTKFKPRESLYVDVLGRIKYEEDAAGQLKKDNPAWEKFNTLFYPYRTPQTMPDDSEAVDMRTFINVGTANTKYVCLHPSISLSENKVLVFNSKQAIPEELFVYDNNVSPDEVLIGMLESYYGYLKMLRESISVYSQTETIAQEHSNLWKIYAKLKK